MVKPFLSENAMEVKIVNIMMQSAYLCVILYFKHKKKNFLRFLLDRCR